MYSCSVYVVYACIWLYRSLIFCVFGGFDGLSMNAVLNDRVYVFVDKDNVFNDSGDEFARLYHDNNDDHHEECEKFPD